MEIINSNIIAIAHETKNWSKGNLQRKKKEKLRKLNTVNLLHPDFCPCVQKLGTIVFIEE